MQLINLVPQSTASTPGRKTKKRKFMDVENECDDEVETSYEPTIDIDYIDRSLRALETPDEPASPNLAPPTARIWSE